MKPEEAEDRRQLLDRDAERDVVEPGAAVVLRDHGAGVAQRQQRTEDGLQLAGIEGPIHPPPLEGGEDVGIAHLADAALQLLVDGREV